MGQKKLIRFEEIKTFANVLQYPAGAKGNWHTFFKNKKAITLELACGKGEYTTGLARLYPHQNFIGIDIKGNRLWRGAKTAIEQNLDNCAFLRIQIDKIEEYFAENEVEEIWITFPDPQLRLSKIKKRLTHPKFLRKYKNILQPGGKIHLKTDSPDLYLFTKTVIEVFNLNLLTDYSDVYTEDKRSQELNIKTHYEMLDIAQSNRVHYLQFILNNDLPSETDAILKTIISERKPD